VGSAVVNRLQVTQIDHLSISAPRLRTAVRSIAGLLDALEQSESEIDQLCHQLQDCSVIINAAGMAEPDVSPSDQLFGANALLPAVIGRAAHRAGADRCVHISSQSVQGDLPVLTEDSSVNPFSPYSLSKALGEQLLLKDDQVASTVVFRAGSVQGSARKTTQRLVKFAHSPIASVALDTPTTLALIEDTAAAIVFCGAFAGDIPAVVLQQGDGLTVREVLSELGARRIRTVPLPVARTLVKAGTALGRWWPRSAGVARRGRVLWFGQECRATWLSRSGFHPPVGREGWRALNSPRHHRDGVEG
jgi:UDP-glucose 4-epimerase